MAENDDVTGHALRRAPDDASGRRRTRASTGSGPHGDESAGGQGADDVAGHALRRAPDDERAQPRTRKASRGDRERGGQDKK